MDRDVYRCDFKEEPGNQNLVLVRYIYFILNFNILNFRVLGSGFLPIAFVPDFAMAHVGK